MTNLITLAEATGLKTGFSRTFLDESRAILDLVDLDDVERMLCERVLSESDGNLSAAARRLHISRAKLEHRAKQWGLLRVRPRAK